LFGDNHGAVTMVTLTMVTVKVTKINFYNFWQLLFADNRVTGVEINKGEGQYKVKATKEVILSAGAIESPKILMLSGIGPRAHLEKFQVCVRLYNKN
jgi:choline dehydrogenase-like flavoprotein